jgi:hypothetical protein
MEGGALLFSALNVVALLMRRIRSPLMMIYGISVTWFALSSLAFILALPWNHTWWLAHAIFASGFFLLSYGVVQAFRTTRSFSTIYGQADCSPACPKQWPTLKMRYRKCNRAIKSWSILPPRIR